MPPFFVPAVQDHGFLHARSIKRRLTTELTKALWLSAFDIFLERPASKSQTQKNPLTITH